MSRFSFAGGLSPPWAPPERPGARARALPRAPSAGTCRTAGPRRVRTPRPRAARGRARGSKDCTTGTRSRAPRRPRAASVASSLPLRGGSRNTTSARSIAAAAGEPAWRTFSTSPATNDVLPDSALRSAFARASRTAPPFSSMPTTSAPQAAKNSENVPAPQYRSTMRRPRLHERPRCVRRCARPSPSSPERRTARRRPTASRPRPLRFPARPKTVCCLRPITAFSPLGSYELEMPTACGSMRCSAAAERATAASGARS